MNGSKGFIIKSFPGYSTNILANQYQLFKDRSLTDFTIEVSGKDIPCHKIILAAASPYFKAMLDSGMKEANAGIVKMKDVNLEAMNCVLEYLYTGQTAVSWADVKEVIELCELMQVEHLQSLIADFISKQLSAENCISWWKMAEKYNLPDLGEKAKGIMCNQLEKVVKCDEFKSLTLAEVIDYINDEDVQVPNRDIVLFACLDWIDHYFEERQEMLLSVFKFVKLEECSMSALKRINTKYDHLLTDEKCQNLVFKNIIAKMNGTGTDKTKKLVVIGGEKTHLTGYNTKCWSLEDQPLQKEWKEFATIPDDLQNRFSKLCMLPNGFVIIGGGDNHNRISMYDAKTKHWTEYPPTVVIHAAVYMNKALYVLKRNLTFNMKHLDLQSKEWYNDQSFKSLIQTTRDKLCYMPTTALIAASLDETIYLVQLTKDTNTAFKKFSLSENSWECMAPLPSGSTGHLIWPSGANLVPTNGSLYLVGGLAKVCAQYKVGTNAWTVLNPPLLDHNFGSAVFFNEKILLLGGGTGLLHTKAIEEYDCKTDRWSTSAVKVPASIRLFLAGLVNYV